MVKNGKKMGLDLDNNLAKNETVKRLIYFSNFFKIFADVHEYLSKSRKNITDIYSSICFYLIQDNTQKLLLRYRQILHNLTVR